jgi:hypothetical protein
MAKVRIGRDEIDHIVNVADRMAKRRHARFVVDHDRVEIVEESHDENRSVLGDENHPSLLCN